MTGFARHKKKTLTSRRNDLASGYSTPTIYLLVSTQNSIKIKHHSHKISEICGLRVVELVELSKAVLGSG